MDDSEKQIMEKERLLNDLEARLKAVDRIKRELTGQAQNLRRQLSELRKPKNQPSAPGKERRATPRRQGNVVSVTLTGPQGRDHSLSGWVMNRSGGGLCLLVDEEVSPGTVLTVTPHLGLSVFEWIQVEVKSCRPERKSWLLGCQFLHKHSWDDLRPFG
jgi:hypothetical protein